MLNQRAFPLTLYAGVWSDAVAQPPDLFVEQPANIHLAINRKTATALGLKIPQELLLRADEVIE